jgi:endo-alpha-1,4-polygalactosaminidase (GH114 family)
MGAWASTRRELARATTTGELGSRPGMRRLFYWIGRLCGLLLLAATAACADDDDDDGGDITGPGPIPLLAGPLDPDVAPVTTGGWYRPAPGVTWQWQLSGSINTSYAVDLYDIDLFDAPAAVIDQLRARGVKLLCYFSAGSAENWRSDYGRIPASALGKPLDGWAGERWLDVRDPTVFAVMLARLDYAAARRCDGVEPDNVTAYRNDSGFPISARDQLAFNRNLANAAHTRGLAIALKNDGDQVASLVEYFDLELNEECHAYDECDQLRPFLTRGKPVLNAEYVPSYRGGPPTQAVLAVCQKAASAGTRTLVLPVDLDDAFRWSCM